MQTEMFFMGERTFEETHLWLIGPIILTGFLSCLAFPCAVVLVTFRARVPMLLRVALVATFLSAIASISVDVLVYLRYYDQGIDQYPLQLYRPRTALRLCNS